MKKIKLVFVFLMLCLAGSAQKVSIPSNLLGEYFGNAEVETTSDEHPEGSKTKKSFSAVISKDDSETYKVVIKGYSLGGEKIKDFSVKELILLFDSPTGRWKIFQENTAYIGFQTESGKEFNVFVSVDNAESWITSEGEMKLVFYATYNNNSVFMTTSFTGKLKKTTTGIERMDTAEKGELKSNIFNLQGHRLRKLQRGINIVNGKKILVK